MSVWVTIFLVSSLLFLMNYFIYPLVVIILAQFKKQTKHDIKNEKFSKTVSFIVAAYNEEAVIENKIKNCLEIDYPKELLEIIVVSDGSDDSTPAIVEKYQDKGIISLHEDARRGKSNALNRAVDAAQGEIVIFSDANNDYAEDSVKQLVSSFSDARVGCVTGSKKIYASKDRQSSVGDGLYWKYESKIKLAESTLGSITAADGEILALRKVLFEPINPKLINDDAAITVNILKKGFRVIYNPDAVAYEEASKDLVDDFFVKVRMTTGGFQTIATEFLFLLNPFKLYSWAFLTHKVLRWLAPYFLILIALSNLMLLEYPVMKILFVCQIVFYLLAFIGWRKRYKTELPTLLYIPMYFVVMNIALFWGSVKYFLGNKSVNWRKASR